jgi:hypothetical protein
MKAQKFNTLWFVFVDHDQRKACVNGSVLPEAVDNWDAAVTEMKGQGRDVASWTEPGSNAEADIVAALNGKFGYPATATIQPKSN